MDDREQVEETALSEVMVTNPKIRLPGDLIYVVDLRSKKDGRYRTWVESKGTWLDRVMPKISISEKLAANVEPEPKRVRKRSKRARRRPRKRRLPSAPPTPSPKAQQPKAILFSTKWCPSCKKAKQFFIQKGVPFRELDVEQDQQAAQQYQMIQQRFRLRPGVVPLIIVNGRVFQGFSPPQIEAALAAGPPKPKG